MPQVAAHELLPPRVCEASAGAVHRGSGGARDRPEAPRFAQGARQVRRGERLADKDRIRSHGRRGRGSRPGRTQGKDQAGRLEAHGEGGGDSPHEGLRVRLLVLYQQTRRSNE